jgi:hypothetical protein
MSVENIPQKRKQKDKKQVDPAYSTLSASSYPPIQVRFDLQDIDLSDDRVLIRTVACKHNFRWT